MRTTSTRNQGHRTGPTPSRKHRKHLLIGFGVTVATLTTGAAALASGGPDGPDPKLVRTETAGEAHSLFLKAMGQPIGQPPETVPSTDIDQKRITQPPRGVDLSQMVPLAIRSAETNTVLRFGATDTSLSHDDQIVETGALLDGRLMAQAIDAAITAAQPFE